MQFSVVFRHGEQQVNMCLHTGCNLGGGAGVPLEPDLLLNSVFAVDCTASSRECGSHQPQLGSQGIQ